MEVNECDQKLNEALKLIVLLRKELVAVDLKYEQLVGMLRKNANKDR